MGPKGSQLGDPNPNLQTNIGGSMYKIRFNTEQKELQKAQDVQAAAQEASASTAAGLADDLDEM